MRQSLNEVYRMCQKAAEGAGAPAGLDIEVARHSAWLTARAFPVLASLATQLEHADGAAPAFDAAEINGASLPTAGRPGALLASGLVDLLIARAGERCGRLAASGLSTPLYLLPAAFAYGADGWHLRLWLRDACGAELALEADPSGARVLGLPGTAAECLGDGSEFDLTAECAANSAALSGLAELTALITHDELARRAAHSQANGVEVDEGAWQRLEALAARVLVPDSETSRRRGAGSSASDNE